MDDAFFEILAKRVRVAGAEYVSFDELQGWPAGDVARAIDGGVLREIEPAKGLICDECDRQCYVEIDRRTNPDTREAVGVYLCSDEEEPGGQFTVDLQRLRQWEIVKDKLKELGYLKDTNTPVPDDTQDITIGEGFMSSTQLAERHGLNPENLRKRLDRYRGKCSLDSDLFVESQDRGNRKPKYLYDPQRVDHIIQDMKAKTSAKRPPIK